MITIHYVNLMHIGVGKVYGIKNRFLAGEMSLNDECKETGKLTSSGMVSGKAFPNNNLAVNKSGNDRIIK